MSCQSLITASASAPVDAGIVDQNRNLADLRADPGGNLAALVVLGHVEHEAAGSAAGSCDGLGGFGGGVAVDVEDGDLCSFLRIAQRDRSADARPATGDHRNTFLEKPCHFRSSIKGGRIAHAGYPADLRTRGDED